jgi:hypothetical protein
MSLPAAAVPVAVLVLAWDEAMPAVRALVEATEAAQPLLDSVLVLVPAGSPPEEELLKEEFLPLAPPVPLPHSTAAVVALPAASLLDAPTPTEAQPLPPQPTLSTSVASLPIKIPAVLTPAETRRSGDAPQHTAQVATVRVLHLSDFSLDELATMAKQILPLPTWTGNAALPAAPYAGNDAVASADEETFTEKQSTTNQLVDSSELASQSALSEKSLPPLPTEAPTLSPTATPPSYLPSELPALDAEADAAPVLLTDAEEAIESVANEPLSAESGAAQSGWPQALASLREPLALDETEPATLEDEAAYYADVAGAYEAEPAPSAAPVPPALRPAKQQFEAPNLNFQVIQYARFAVPVALAQETFAAIYAPAWPTWLAAQELHYRTGQPLVLHVSTLAASESESVETATSWQAELQRQALHRADLILTETAALAYRLQRDLGLPPELVRTAPAADAAAIARALSTAQRRPAANAG